ncbi:MAG: TrbI/VirB10 family protein [Microcoleus sp.]
MANEDLSQYLDQPTEADDFPEEDYKSPEQEIEDAAAPRTGLRNPYVKVGLWGGGVMVALFTVTSLFGGGATQTAKDTEKDKRIAALEKKLNQSSAKEQLAIAERQGNKYTSTLKPPDDPKAKAKADHAAKIAAAKAKAAEDLARQQQLNARSYQAPPRYVSEVPTPRPKPVATPVSNGPMIPKAVFSPPKQDNSEILAMRKQLADMQAKLIRQSQPPVDVVADEPEDTDYQPVAYMPAIDGGAEETALMMGSPPVTIPAGLEVEARLDMGIVASAKGRAIATLSEPIKDASGKVLIPKGSKLLGVATSSDGGTVDISLEKAIVNGQAVTLPGSASIAVLRDNNDPLIAKSYGGGGSKFWGSFASAALGGISNGVNQLISPDTSTTIGNGFSQTTSTSSGRTLGNAGLAALGGVSNGLSTSLQSSIQQGIARTNSGKVTGIRAGTKLKLVFLNPTDIVIPGFAPNVEKLPLG